jgi:hypothetical protein
MLQHNCPFCRQTIPQTQAENDAYNMRRVAANDPVAMRETGLRCFKKRHCGSAFEYWTKAAGLGDVVAHYAISHVLSRTRC